MLKRIAFLLVLVPTAAYADKSFLDGEGGTVDCKDDPVVNVMGNDATYTLKGPCKVLNVAGNSNTFQVESLKTLNISGNSNQATLAAVDQINTSGNKNKVTYKGKPRVSNLGNGNTIAAGAGGGDSTAKPADKSKPAGKDKPADKGGSVPPAGQTGETYGGGTIDCAKTPSYTVAKTGDNALKFVGTCDKIVVSTGNNRLSIENVKTLRVDGGHNSADVGGVDAIITNGAMNSVTYKKGLSADKPKTSGSGAMNKVVQTK